MNFKKGAITLGVGLSALALMFSGVTGFFSGQIAVKDDISEDRERLSSLEADNDNSKEADRALVEWLVRVEGKLDKVIDTRITNESVSSIVRKELSEVEFDVAW